MSDNPTQGNGNAIETFPVLPLRDIVVFPHMIVPLFVGREKSIKALEEVMREDKRILLIAQREAADDDPAPEGMYDVGTIASVLQLLKLPDGTVKVLVEGNERARIVGFTGNADYFEAQAALISDEESEHAELEAMMRTVTQQFDSYVKLNKKVPQEAIASIGQITDPARLADTVAAHLAIKLADKQALLEIVSVNKRLERVYAFMEGEISVLQVEKRIRSRVKRQMEKSQREYYLNEQMKAIQKELGDGEERDEIGEIEARIGKTKLSKEAREKAEAEVKKLRQMSPMSAEATVVRNYLDWLLGIPWGYPLARQVRPRLCPGGTRPRSLRAGQGQGAHHRVSRGADPHQQAERPNPVPRRPARRRQDLAGQVDCQGDGARVRAHVAGRGARRGRDPRPPAHLYRLHARQGHPVDEEGQEGQPAVPAR